MRYQSPAAWIAISALFNREFLQLHPLQQEYNTIVEHMNTTVGEALMYILYRSFGCGKIGLFFSPKHEVLLNRHRLVVRSSYSTAGLTTLSQYSVICLNHSLSGCSATPITRDSRNKQYYFGPEQITAHHSIKYLSLSLKAYGQPTSSRSVSHEQLPESLAVIGINA